MLSDACSNDRSARLVLVLVGLLLLLPLSLFGIARADPAPDESGSWLEDPVRSNWNQVAMNVPVAPPLDTINPRCGSTERWAETPEDQALMDAGWSLFAPYRASWGLVVVD